MKKLSKRYIFTGIALLTLCVLGTGCSNNDAAMEQAAVTMTFTTRATAAPAVVDGTLATNEHMRTLRVIVARSANNEIVYNVSYDIDEEETSKTVIFSELTIKPDGEDFDFYAIANEASFLTAGESLEGKSVDLNALLQRIIDTDFNAETFTGYLPQAQVERNFEVKPGVNPLSMQLEFPVAKVCLTFENQSGRAQYFGNVTMAAANSTKGYLFPNTNLPTDLPTTYNDVSLYTYDAANTTSYPSFRVPAGTEDTPSTSVPLTCYLYPGNKTGGYTLTADWLGEGAPRTLTFTLNGTTVTQMERGKQLNITITLMPGTERDAALSYQLADWNEKTIDVPFN